MTLRRLMVALVVLGGLCVWGFARSNHSQAPSDDPIRTENATGEGNHDDAAAYWRTNQCRHWRHVAIGNNSSDR